MKCTEFFSCLISVGDYYKNEIIKKNQLMVYKSDILGFIK